MVTSAIAPLPQRPQRGATAASSTRRLKKPKTVLGRLKHVWKSTQVSHKGQYSIERLLALGEYSQRTFRLRVLVVCLASPLPMIAFVLVVECVPLQDPNAGWQDNYGLWIRSAVICGVIAATMLVELKHLIEGVKVSVGQAVFVLLCVMVGDSALLMTAAAYLVFPIPFTSLVMVPPLLAIVAVALRVSFGSDGFKKMLEHPAQLYGFVLFIFAQALTLIVYPIYQVLFSASVNTHFELSVMMLLPIVKMMTKNIVASSIYYMEDMLPESVIFTVDFFNAVYVATCMRQASSGFTVAAIMFVDVFHTAFALQKLYKTGLEIKRRLNQDLGSNITTLKLLEVACSLCQHRDKFERQNLSQIQLRSCLPHELSSTGKSILARLEKYPLKPAIKAHRRRAFTKTSIAPMSKYESVPYLSQSPQSTGWTAAKRASAKIYAVSTMNSIPTKTSHKSTASRTQSVLSSYSVPSSRILQRTLETMFMTECLILTEYLESFTPALYCTFLLVMVRLPSAKYHTELDGITQDNVMHTLLSVFYYGLLELVSFLLLVYVIRRTIGMQALYHLAFVLETQTSLIQNKLIVWMLLTLTCRVVHYGFDFTFQFSWIKSS
ncbi:hypothetical protein PF008_g3757 [Phytophthora fragariae]|uniref:Uncharacterized protein n=1 Tax=Phytophthora fragariae TaxID=53985 RepID=A0A6G0SDB2_9STRA|nr:hypothetical protein PF008_g3757 [Phytophthora fragariae]